MGLAVTKQEAFWEACGYGRLYEVKSMLEKGHINVNWKSYTHDCCPIHVASQGKIEIVKLLLAANCDVNAKDDRDNLAIHHAAMKGHADIIQLLIDAGSKIDSPNRSGWTPLINAAYWCQPGVASLLINNKCNVHIKNRDERTALHEACRSESADEDGLAQIVQLLVECGCDIDSKSSNVGEKQLLYMADFTPLMFCAYHGHPKIAKVLIDSDCRINAQGSNQWSALHWAADQGNTAVVEVLLHGGIDVYLKGLRGELAIDRATDNKIKCMIDEAMRHNSTEHKIAMETRGSTKKTLYIPMSGAQDLYNNGLAVSPRLDVTTSPVFQSMQAQMVSISDQLKSKKTKRVERRISQRIFEPPLPPADESREGDLKTKSNSVHSPMAEIMDTFGFMDDEDEHERETLANGVMETSQSSSSLQGHTKSANQSQTSSEKNFAVNSQSSGSIQRLPSSQSGGSLQNMNSNTDKGSRVTAQSSENVSVNSQTNFNGIAENSCEDISTTKLKDDNIKLGNGLINDGVVENGMFDENEIDGDGYFEDNVLH